jgi:hypothetical protein
MTANRRRQIRTRRRHLKQLTLGLYEIAEAEHRNRSIHEILATAQIALGSLVDESAMRRELETMSSPVLEALRLMTGRPAAAPCYGADDYDDCAYG